MQKDGFSIIVVGDRFGWWALHHLAHTHLLPFNDYDPMLRLLKLTAIEVVDGGGSGGSSDFVDSIGVLLH